MPISRTEISEAYASADYKEPTSQKADWLETAKKLVSGHRSEHYGHPKENFRTIAAFWSTYLNNHFPNFHNSLTAEDVAAMMILLKIARGTTGRHTEDSLTDIAGYVRCVELIREELGANEAF